MMIHTKSDAWEQFLDYCADHDIEPEDLDFDDWCEEQWDAAQEAAAERAFEIAREREWDDWRD
jgi:hypothetical protein